MKKPKLTVKHLDCRTSGFPTRREAKAYFEYNSQLSATKVVPWKATLVEIIKNGQVWGVHWSWDWVGK